jgi:hypothetical protein
MRYIASHMFLKTGQVKKIYDAATGKRIRSLQELEPGHNVVAASYEPFRKGPYPILNLSPNQTVSKREHSVLETNIAR